MGTVIGAIATGAVPANATDASLAAWTSATALLAGFLFVAACGYLAAVYLAGEAARRADGSMRAYFIRRGQVAAIVTGALSLAALAELHSSDALLYDRLTGRALPLVVVAGVCGLLAVVLLAAGRLFLVRAVAALGVATVVCLPRPISLPAPVTVHLIRGPVTIAPREHGRRSRWHRLACDGREPRDRPRGVPPARGTRALSRADRALSGRRGRRGA